MKLDVVEYNNSAKNSWRARAWSAIRKFRAGRLQNDTLLYLPGECDLDSSQAERSGIKPYNMIAVERNALIVERLRGEGRIVINASLDEVVLSWPENWHVGVIIADLQCGYEDWVKRMCLHWRSSPQFENGVLLVNMQKGRESAGSDFNRHNKFMQDVEGRHSGKYGRPEFRLRDFGPTEYKTLNRAIQLAMELQRVPKRDILSIEACSNQMLSLNFKVLPDYRSGRVVMQSVVMHNRPLSLYSSEYVAPEKEVKIQRLISAAKALRTMQTTGFLSMKRVN